MEHPALDLFLLATNLAQIKDRARVITLFIEGMDNIFPELGIGWADEAAPEQQNQMEVCTRHDTFGFINYSGEAHLDETTRALLHNASQMLGVILEKLHQEQLLLEQNKALESLVAERAQMTDQLEMRVAQRTADLEHANKTLTDSRLAALNMMEDAIEARQRAEESADALRESEEKYRVLFDHLPIPVFTKDINGIYTSCNEENLKYWAVNPIGRADEDLLPPETARALRQADLQVIQNGAALVTEEFLMGTPQGDRQFISRKIPLYDSRREITGILGASVDITERKQSEEQIRNQLRQMHALHEIDTVIGSSFDLNLTLDMLLKTVVEQLKADAATVLLFSKQTHTLEHAASRGMSSIRGQSAQLTLGEDLAGRVVKERRIVHIADLKKQEKRMARAYSLTGESFTVYLGAPLIAKGEIVGVLEVFHRSIFDPKPEWLDFLDTLAGQTAIAIDNAHLFENLQRSNFDLTIAYDSTIEGWSRAMDLRDRETEGHTQRVTYLTLKLARRMNIPDPELIHIRRGALLHDIGKLGVPDSILHKPGKLTDEEWQIMRQHATHAHEMLVSIPYLQPALDIPYCHHEKWDGTGYPRGLKGAEIPLAARIFAIVDVWDALRTDRPYRPAWSAEEARNYIREQTGRHFDPLAAETFLKLISNE